MGDLPGHRLLGGAVLLRHLPVTDPPVLSGGRIETPAGEIAQVHNGDPFRFLAYVEFATAGVVRGHHVHDGRTEHLYVVRGELGATWVDTATGARAERTVVAGDLVEVAPGCAHAYTALRPTDVLELSATRYAPDQTRAHPVDVSRWSTRA